LFFFKLTVYDLQFNFFKLNLKLLLQIQLI